MTLPTPHPMDYPLKIPKIAEITGLSERTLRHWCASGRLADWQPSGPSGHCYITARDLEALGVHPTRVAAVAAFAASAASGRLAPVTGD